MDKLAAKSDRSVDHDLSQAIPYLLARAGVRMGQAFTRELKPFGLSLAEWRICSALYCQPDQRLAALAAHTSAEPSTLSRAIDGLLQRGLVSRERSDEDGRALALRLTSEGEKLTQRIIPLAQLYERVALLGIPSTQVDLLRALLRKMHDNIDTLDQRN